MSSYIGVYSTTYGPYAGGTAPAAPAIASFTPTSAAVGDVVTVTGTNLSSITAATIGGQAVGTITNNTATSVKLTVPAGATGAQPLSVTTAGGTAASTGNLTVVAAPAAQTLQVVYSGDSQEGETGSDNTSLVGFYSPRIHRGYTLDYLNANTATTGITASDFRSDSSSGRVLMTYADLQQKVTTWLTQGTYDKRAFYYGGGINNIILNGDTGAQAWAKKLATIQSFRAAFPDVILLVPTLPPCGKLYGGTFTLEQIKAEVDAYNTLVRQNAASNGYKVMDFAAKLVFQDYNNEVIFHDDLHHHTEGEQEKALLVTNGLENIVAGTFVPTTIDVWDGVTPTDNSVGYTYLAEYYSETSGNSRSLWKDSSGRERHLQQPNFAQRITLVPNTYGIYSAYNVSAGENGKRFFASALSGYPREYVVSFGGRLNAQTNAYLAQFFTGENKAIIGLNASAGAGGTIFQNGSSDGGGMLTVPNGSEFWLDYHMETAGAWVELNGVVVKTAIPYTLFPFATFSPPPSQSLYPASWFNNYNGDTNPVQAIMHTLLVAQGKLSGQQTYDKRTARATKLGISYGGAVATNPNQGPIGAVNWQPTNGLPIIEVGTFDAAANPSYLAFTGSNWGVYNNSSGPAYLATGPSLGTVEFNIRGQYFYLDHETFSSVGIKYNLYLDGVYLAAANIAPVYGTKAERYASPLLVNGLHTIKLEQTDSDKWAALDDIRVA